MGSAGQKRGGKTYICEMAVSRYDYFRGRTIYEMEGKS